MQLIDQYWTDSRNNHKLIVKQQLSCVKILHCPNYTETVLISYLFIRCVIVPVSMDTTYHGRLDMI